MMSKDEIAALKREIARLRKVLATCADEMEAVEEWAWQHDDTRQAQFERVTEKARKLSEVK